MNRETEAMLALPPDRNEINWRLVMANVRQKVSTKEIQARTRLSKNQQDGIMKGEVKEPYFSIAIDLMDLHFDFCADKHNQLVLMK